MRRCVDERMSEIKPGAVKHFDIPTQPRTKQSVIGKDYVGVLVRRMCRMSYPTAEMRKEPHDSPI